MLKSDCYYWKCFEEESSIKYAYIHTDEEDGDYTFLIVFESSDANEYSIYTTMEKDGDVREKDKSVIQEFLLDFVTSTSTNYWNEYKLTDKILHNKAFELVEEYTDYINRKKNEKRER